VRASSENRYKGQAKGQWQPTKTNNYFPLSLENTSGNLAQNLRNINGPKGNQLGSTAGAGQLGGLG